MGPAAGSRRAAAGSGRQAGGGQAASSRSNGGGGWQVRSGHLTGSSCFPNVCPPFRQRASLPLPEESSNKPTVSPTASEFIPPHFEPGRTRVLGKRLSWQERGREGEREHCPSRRRTLRLEQPAALPDRSADGVIVKPVVKPMDRYRYVRIDLRGKGAAEIGNSVHARPTQPPQ